MIQTEQHFSQRGYSIKPGMGAGNETEAKKLSSR